MSATANRIVKNTGYLYAKMGITVCMSLWTTRLILNTLGESDFGIFGIVGGAIAMLGFLNNSMAGTTQRFMSYSQGERDINKQKLIFNNSFILHCIISVLVLILLELASIPLFYEVLNIPAERQDAAFAIYQFLIISTVFTILSVPYDAAINAHEDMGYYAVIGLVESLLKFLIAIFVVNTLHDKLIVYGLLTALVTLLLLFVKYQYCKKKYEECTIRFNKYRNSAMIKELLGFAGWNFVGTSGAMIGINGGNVIMNHYFGPAVNAAGSISIQVREQLMAFTTTMLKAVNPAVIKKEGEGDRSGMLKYTLSSTKFAYMLYALFALPFFIETPYLLQLWLQNVPEWAVWFVRLQILIGLTLPFSNTLTTALSATGIIKYNNIYRCVIHIVPLIIYVILYSCGNGAEPYWVYLIVFICYSTFLPVFLLFQCKKYCDLDIKGYINIILIPCIASLMIAAVSGLLFTSILPSTFIRLIVNCVVVGVILLMMSYRLVLDNSEKEFIKSLFVSTINIRTK